MRCAVLALFVLAPTTAGASIVTVEFAGTITNGALAGTPWGGSFTYDDPFDMVLCLDCHTTTNVPMLQLSLFVGAHHFGLSDALPGAAVVTPFGGWWGPGAAINPLALSGLGLLSLNLNPGGWVLLSYTYTDGFVGLNHFTSSTMRVPGPTTIALAFSGLAILMVRRRTLTQGRLLR
jgi:hypothetical protein